MERTLLEARIRVGCGLMSRKNYEQVDQIYWTLLKQESTEELEFMIQLHADGRLERRLETFDVMLEELAERELLGRGTEKQLCQEHDSLLQQST